MIKRPSTEQAAEETKKRAVMTTEEAAIYLGVTRSTLDTWRSTRAHEIPYLKIGRLVKYLQSDLDAYLEASRVSPSA